jgi:threonine/homoserine/homoserine lactone efflux protein
MPFPIHIDILELIIKGCIIGVAASAPMGPVGILCVQRTQKKGRWYGFATGVGAALSDLIYALISGFGMSFVVNFISNPVYKFYLQLAGGIMLLVFGLISFFSNPLKNAYQGGQKEKGTLIHNGVTAFLITFSNPLIVLLFIALFAQFNFIVPHQPLLMSAGYAAMLGGALLWWYGLTWLIDKIRARFDQTGVVLINRIIGGCVIFFSIVSLIGTLFNIYLFPQLQH